MPAGFDFPSSQTNIWIPLSFISNWPAFLTARQADAFNAIARLAPGISLQQAQQEMDSISAGLGHKYPIFEAGKSINVVPLPAELVRPGTRNRPVDALWCCRLSLADWVRERRQSLASPVRAHASVRVQSGPHWAPAAHALCACRCWSACFCRFSPFAWPCISSGGHSRAPILGPTEIRGFGDVQLDPEILVFCLLVSLSTSLIFGLGPSWINARRDPQAALKAGGRTVAGSRARRRMGSCSCRCRSLWQWSWSPVPD